MENNSLVRVIRYPNVAEETRQLCVFMSDDGWLFYDASVMPGNKEVELVFVWPDANLHPYPELVQ